MWFGLKLGTINKNYTQDIHTLFQDEYFQYIELFVLPGSFEDTVGYWQQFNIPMVIHAPHSMAGMNLSMKDQREGNEGKLKEVFQFADALKAEHIIFHSGFDGDIDETINQLRFFADSRCVIENKPVKGLNDEKCIGSTPEEIKYIMNELKVGFCLDFGHAICAANSLKQEPFTLIQEFMTLKPAMYHLTDGDYTSEYDSHLHYGKGSYPIADLLKMIPETSKITNEAKHGFDINLDRFRDDCLFYMSNIYLRNAIYSDMDILYEWANDPETRLNSFNQSLIPFDTHKAWFEEKFNSESVVFFIYHDGEETIGQVRFDINDDMAKINYTINPQYRRQGYGSKMLLLAENRIKNEYKMINYLLAEVKIENIASQKIFVKLKYKEFREKKSVQYKKNISKSEG